MIHRKMQKNDVATICLQGMSGGPMAGGGNQFGAYGYGYGGSAGAQHHQQPPQHQSSSSSAQQQQQYWNYYQQYYNNPQVMQQWQKYAITSWDLCANRRGSVSRAQTDAWIVTARYLKFISWTFGIPLFNCTRQFRHTILIGFLLVRPTVFLLIARWYNHYTFSYWQQAQQGGQ